MDIFENVKKNFGFGCMRLPMKDGEVDTEEFSRMVDTFLGNGFNYFDTAHGYLDGKSETAIRECLTARYPRDRYILTNKLTSSYFKKEEDIRPLFEQQLAACGVDYFDFYLLHSIEDGSKYNLYEEYDCFRWGQDMKKAGKIRHFGFSFHGTPELLEQILDRHPDIDFVQIQLNYADWNNPLVQSGRLYNILHSRQIPIIVMEPVKGGTLASLQPELESLLKAEHPDASAASWALRFVGSLDGIATILSGMSSEEQMEDNLSTFRNFKPLTEKEKDIIAEVVRRMQDMPLIACTSCRYCCDGCPSGIAIPDMIRALNTARLYPKDRRPILFYRNLVLDSGKASSCIACGQCEGVCPQHLPIIQLLQEAAEKLERRG